MMSKCSENKKVAHKAISIIIMEEKKKKKNQNVIEKENVFNGDFYDVCSWMTHQTGCIIQCIT